MNRLSTAKRARLIGLLLEGVSLAGIQRSMDVSYNGINRLLVDAGGGCPRRSGKSVATPARLWYQSGVQAKGEATDEETGFS